MSDSTNETVTALKQEVAELSGMVLATGILLTQLLQTINARELNPQGATDKMMKNARDGIQAFSEQNGSDPKMTKRALGAVDQYEEQIRSVLRT